MSKKSKISRIPASEMVVLWSLDDTDRIIDILIIALDDCNDKIYDKYDSWGGAGTKKWCKGDFRTKPAGVFAYLASVHGFSSREVAYTALKEFNKVKRQGWARLTLHQMDGRLI